MNKDKINNDYFEWMYNFVCGERYSKKISYRKLLMRLHDTEFTYCLQRDENRAEDGLSLRYRYVYHNGYDEEVVNYIDGPCSVLEMMIALASRCEETIMDDPAKGNRTGQWFWSMVVSLGLGGMTDDRFDRKYVDDTLARFLNRCYDADGRGGLFTVRHCEQDLRTVEIWYQMCYYLDSIM